MSLFKRSHQPELLDLGPAFYTREEYKDCLVQLARIGRFLGGDRASLKTFSMLPVPKSILEVGCGGGQFAMLLARQFPETRILGIDISREAIGFAQETLIKLNLENVNFEVPHSVNLDYPENCFDVVTSTLVCHHMKDAELIEFLKQSYKVAKSRIIINDLHRHWLSHMGFGLIAKLFFPNRLIYHDGLLSIKRAFKKKDWIFYLKSAGIPLERCKITWHWAFRWIVNIDTSAKCKV